MNTLFSVIAYGRSYNPNNWFYNPAYVVNRIYYIVGGTAYYRDNTPLKPGYLYLFRASPNFRVSQDASDPVDHVYYDFLTYRALIDSDYIEINPAANSRLAPLLTAIKEDFATSSVPPHIANAYLELLLHDLEQDLTGDSQYSRITSDALRTIHTLPAGELSVNRVAEELHHNVNHIIRCFKREVGITPHQYIAALKLNLAIAYMRQGISHTEIAERLGFSSLSSFSYFFHQEIQKQSSRTGSSV